MKLRSEDWATASPHNGSRKRNGFPFTDPPGWVRLIADPVVSLSNPGIGKKLRTTTNVWLVIPSGTEQL